MMDNSNPQQSAIFDPKVVEVKDGANKVIAQVIEEVKNNPEPKEICWKRNWGSRR